jgi:hypothetical protein
MLATKAPTDASHRWIEALASVHIFRYIGMIALVPAHFDAEPLGLSYGFQLLVLGNLGSNTIDA